MQRRQRYAKGFKIDRGLIAKIFDLAHRNDPEVDSYFMTIVEGLTGWATGVEALVRLNVRCSAVFYHMNTDFQNHLPIF